MAERLHFSGIGGTAMVAGARIALEAGCEVRGSDGVLYPPASHMVQALQIPVYSGYSADNLSWSPDTVIIGNALSRGNPEVEYVLSHRLILSPEARMKGVSAENILGQLLDTLPVPGAKG